MRRSASMSLRHLPVISALNDPFGPLITWGCMETGEYETI